MSLLLGKLDATRPHTLGNIEEYVAGKVPQPPAAVHYGSKVKGGFPMFGNSIYGDCVMAWSAHAIQVFNAEVGKADPVPTESEVVAEYLTLTGGQDTGLNEASTLAVWRSTGLWGNKIAGYAPVDYTNLVKLHQAVAFFGACELGVQLPQSAMDQFNAGEEWTVVPGSPIIGGHCIGITGYEPDGAWIVTWAKLVKVSYPWLAAYVDEAWCVLPQEFKEAGHGPLKLDWASLDADLSSV